MSVDWTGVFLRTKRRAARYGARRQEPRILFIVGCQRSGTTLLTEIFEADPDAKVFGEFSPLCLPREKAPLIGSSEKKYISRWASLDHVAKVFQKSNVGLIVTKPLVESQSTDKLLNYFQGSKALWAYRDYVDVASSNIVKFGEIDGGRKNLLPIVQNGDHWVSERLSDEMRSLVRRLYSDNMNPYDAAAIFWYIRNRWYYDLHLDSDEQVYLCRYEDLVTQPKREMEAIYRFIGIEFPGDYLVKSVHSSSIKKGKDIPLSSEVRELCSGLQARLDATHVEKSNEYY